LCWTQLLARYFCRFFQWIQITCDSFCKELSVKVIISRSTVNHVTVWSSPSISFETGKWTRVKFTIGEEPNPLKWRILIGWVYVLNVRDTIGFSFVQSAELQNYFYLRDLINRFDWIRLFIWMQYSVFKILFKLKITNIETFKIFVEVEARICWTYLGYCSFQ